jgi:cytochrome c oxidase cbb3-type subunit 3
MSLIMFLAYQKNESSSTSKGYAVFEANCASCHGADGKGNREFGAPNLADAIWLYGGKKDEVYHSVYTAHAGVMPNWNARLSPPTIRQLSIYVHQLGGGEKTLPKAEPVIAIEGSPQVE